MQFEGIFLNEYTNNGDDIYIIECCKLNQHLIPQKYNPKVPNIQSLYNQKDSKLQLVIDTLGEASAKAQQLKTVITSYLKCVNQDQRIYLKYMGDTALGFLKVGKKQLFYHNKQGKTIQMSPICVLDFYVDTKLQRKGIGQELFRFMLENEKISPNKIAYDRPSSKLLAFLSKYYNLQAYLNQNNNFVIYNSYFDSNYDLQKVESKKQNQNKNSLISSGFEVKQNKTNNPSYKNLYQYQLNDEQNSEYERVKNHMLKKNTVKDQNLKYIEQKHEETEKQIQIMKEQINQLQIEGSKSNKNNLNKGTTSSEIGAHYKYNRQYY